MPNYSNNNFNNNTAFFFPTWNLLHRLDTAGCSDFRKYDDSAPRKRLLLSIVRDKPCTFELSLLMLVTVKRSNLIFESTTYDYEY